MPIEIRVGDMINFRLHDRSWKRKVYAVYPDAVLVQFKQGQHIVELQDISSIVGRTPNKPWKTYRKSVVPDMSRRMTEAGATNVALAEAIGIGVSTVATARKGRAIQTHIAKWIESALESRTFARDRRGAK